MSLSSANFSLGKSESPVAKVFTGADNIDVNYYKNYQ